MTDDEVMRTVDGWRLQRLTLPLVWTEGGSTVERPLTRLRNIVSFVRVLAAGRTTDATKTSRHVGGRGQRSPRSADHRSAHLDSGRMALPRSRPSGVSA
jgi:hypothetical protein